MLENLNVIETRCNEKLQKWVVLHNSRIAQTTLGVASKQVNVTFSFYRVDLPYIHVHIMIFEISGAVDPSLDPSI